MSHKAYHYLLALALGVLALPAPARASTHGLEFFETKIRPVLAEHCYECHSASAEKLKGGLRVDGRSQLLKGGDLGPALVPGKPSESLIVTAIAHRDPDLTMPPKKAPLSPAIIADFEKWIRDGAAWPEEESAPDNALKKDFDLAERKRQQPWLWQAPTSQPVPVVKNTQWPATLEDRFILQRLEKAGLSPAADADDRTWLRRVHFVITGLPPTREEIHTFLANSSTDRREQAVDRLLASPRFGERWARHWMDLVRYAETRGHEGDYAIANAWHYRDYLIRAFNENVPYNQFVLEHLAGDLIPQPRLRPGTEINESILATGWAFLGEENHSPVDIRQDECERIDNKVDVLSKTFLGLTVACARCHDHKFDPIRAQDYYALSGFILSSSFRQVRFEAMENNRRMAAELRTLRAKYAPRIARLIAASRQPGLAEIDSYLLAGRETLLAGAAAGSSTPLDPARLQLWVNELSAARTNQSHPLHSFAQAALDPAASSPESLANLSTLKPFELPPNSHVIADFTNPHQQPWKVDGEAFGPAPVTPGEVILGNSLTNLLDRVMEYGAARRDLFWNRLKLAAGTQKDSGALAATTRAGQMLRTPTVTLGSGNLHYLIKGKTRVYAAVDSHLMVEGPLHGRLVRIFDGGTNGQPRWVTHDLTPYAGHRTHLEFGPEGDGELEVLMVVEADEAPKWVPHTVFKPHPASPSIADFARQFEKAVTAANQLLRDGSRTALSEATLANWVVQNPHLFGSSQNPELLRLGQEFLDAQQKLASQVQWESSTAVAWFDGTGVDENVLVRGKPFKPGVLSPRSLPAVFDAAHPITPADSSGRYEFARQLIEPANPLVSRTIVNRVWHHVFGRGIVASVDNFGALGERPTHPELLDQLAWQFVHEDGWSLKHLIKRLVLTRTFAMSSQSADSRGDELDPTNALLHRMPVRRLEGEVIRDALLTVSGRLNPIVEGPPEPVHLTEFTVGRGRPEQSGPLDGDGRRSVYSAMRRNFLPTLMQTFDMPTPFSTVGKRNVTNVPAQALALMNDPLFHQQAQVWAERLLREAGEADPSGKIQWLFETAYSRLPAAEETAACLSSLKELATFYPENATPNPEAWTDLCHALLNANEFIYVQ